MADIVLATQNAKYIHTSFGLRYWNVNLVELEIYIWNGKVMTNVR